MTHLLPLLLLASGALPAAAGAQAAHTRSLLALIQSSGFVGPLLALAGLAALVLALRRWLELRPGRLAPEALQRALEEALHRGELDAGLELAVRSRTLLGELVAAGLHLRRAGLDEMLANVERATARESLRLGNRLANLARLGGGAVLTGLLGTSAGLLSMLQVMESLKDPTAHDFILGIGPALVCVVLGLSVALFCFATFFWFDSRLTQRTLAVRDRAEELVREAAEKASAR